MTAADSASATTEFTRAPTKQPVGVPATCDHSPRQNSSAKTRSPLTGKGGRRVRLEPEVLIRMRHRKVVRGFCCAPVDWGDRQVPRLGEPANALTVFLGPYFLPTQVNLSMLCDAISKIQVDQALVRNACFFSHLFEVIDDILAKPDRYWFLQFRCVGVLSRLHFRKIVLGFH